MPALASFALAGALATSPKCQWDRPGADRFTGDLVQAVDHYAGWPADSRARLKAKMARHEYDDRVVITRDGISGNESTYDGAIKDMHFGSNRVCRDVSRKKWPADRKVEALVYCDGDQCLLVPSVCGNISRVTRTGSEGPFDITPAAGPPAAGPTAGAGPAGFPALPAAAAPLGDAAEPLASLAPITTARPLPIVLPPLIDQASPPAVYFPPVYGVPVVTYVPPVVGVPEPPPWLLTLASVPFLALGLRRVKKRRKDDDG